ncbi:MAG: hypothetical protein ACYDD5_00675 [Sulfuricurvum sp.]
MAEYSDTDLYDMSDDELAAAFKEAKAQDDSPETAYEDEVGDVILEQPDVESDDNSSVDDEEVEFDEVLETEEETLDEESDAEEDETEADETEPEAKEQPVQRRKYKANGKDYEFSDDEIFDKFGQVFGQAMNYTQKMQQLKPWRKTIDAIEQAKLSDDDISLAIDVLSGDKDAIAALLKRTGVDALELDVDNGNYQPKNYGRNEAELAINDIVEEISKDKEYPITYDVLEKQWDQKSRAEFIENPEMIRQLHIDVKSGMFDVLSPVMQKMRVYDNGRKSDIEYYKMAAERYFAEEAQDEARSTAQATEQVARSKVAQVKADTQKREATRTASTKRKAAAPTGKTAGANKSVDYLDASDEAFEEFYKRVQDSQ